LVAEIFEKCPNETTWHISSGNSLGLGYCFNNNLESQLSIGFSAKFLSHQLGIWLNQD